MLQFILRKMSSLDHVSSSKCVVPEPATLASSENLLEMWIPASSETLGWDPAMSFKKTTRWFWCVLKFETHGTNYSVFL